MLISDHRKVYRHWNFCGVIVCGIVVILKTLTTYKGGRPQNCVGTLSSYDCWQEQICNMLGMRSYISKSVMFPECKCIKQMFKRICLESWPSCVLQREKHPRSRSCSRLLLCKHTGTDGHWQPCYQDMITWICLLNDVHYDRCYNVCSCFLCYLQGFYI